MMALMSGEEYQASLQRLAPALYLGGERVENILEHPVTSTVVRANARVYDLAREADYAQTMTVFSPIIGEVVSRCVHISGSPADLEQRMQMALLTSQELGTCNYRCPGCDALNALAATSWEVDRERGAEYYSRLQDFLSRVQREDLAVSGAVTDAKGERGKRPTQQADPDMYVHVVERQKKGVVVRGAKLHQSGAWADHFTVVVPGMALRPGEEDYAIAFAVPNGAPGITYVSQYTAYAAERILAADEQELGNPRYGIRETCMIIFDDVFIPYEQVFLDGEVEFAGRLVSRFSRIHRMNCGGACKVGFADLIIGAALLAAEQVGLAGVQQIQEKITDMLSIRETVYACSLVAALKGVEDPAGSGVWLPDDVFGNIAKLNVADGFWELMKLAGDIGGGLAVTAPAEREVVNPATAAYVEKYLKAGVSARKRLRLARFLQNWTAGMHGVGTWHGAGSPQAERIALRRAVDLQAKKRMAARLAGLEEEAGYEG